MLTGTSIDAAGGDLLVEAVAPMALEVALSVQQELEGCWEDTGRLRCQGQSGRYEAEWASLRARKAEGIPPS